MTGSDSVTIVMRMSDDARAVGAVLGANERARAGYEADEGQLSAQDIEAIQSAASRYLPKGKVLKKRSLFKED